MSNGALKVGDVCVILPPNPYAGSHEHLCGQECVVLKIFGRPIEVERGICPDAVLVDVRGEGEFAVTRSRLKLRRPPSTDDSEPRTEFLPCEPDFLEWWKKVGGKVGA